MASPPAPTGTASAVRSAPAQGARTALTVERLPLAVLFSYAVAQFGLSAMNTLVNTHIPFFYVDTLKLPAATFGLVMLISKVWDGVTDPLMGHITDNTRSRLGRRRPYFLIGAPLLALATFLLFRPPQLEGQALFPWFLITFLLAYSARTVFETPYQAMAPDLTPDYDERTRVAAYRVTVGNLGDMTGAMLPMLLLAFLAPRLTFGWSGGVVGVAIVLAAALTFARVRERTDVSKLPKKQLRANLIDILTYPVRNRPARLLIATYACAVFATTLPTAVFRFLNRYLFTATGLEATALAPWIERLGTPAFLDIGVILGYFAGVFLSAPLWTRALRRFDKKHGYIFAFAWLAVSACGLLFIPRDMGFLFPLLNVMVGAGGLGLWMLPAALGPDIMEWEELHHGDRHEGGFYGIWMLVQKFGGGIALFSMGFFLEAIGFVPDVEQSDRTLLGLRVLYGGFPLAIAVAAVMIFSRYPLTREAYAEVRRQLEARRSGG